MPAAPIRRSTSHRTPDTTVRPGRTGPEFPVRSGENRDGQILILLEASEGLHEVLIGWAVDRVDRVRSIDRDDDDGAIGLVVDAHRAVASLYRVSVGGGRDPAPQHLQAADDVSDG
jgi:hypothetical protein